MLTLPWQMKYVFYMRVIRSCLFKNEWIQKVTMVLFLASEENIKSHLQFDHKFIL